MGLFSLAGPPLGKVSRLDHTDGVRSSDLPHLPGLPDGVSSDVILQDGVTIDPFTPFIGLTIPATCIIIMTKTSVVLLQACF